MKYTKERIENIKKHHYTKDVANALLYEALDEIERLQEANRTNKLRWHLLAVSIADKKLSCYGMKPDLQIYAQILKDMADIEAKNPLPQPPESEG